MSTHNIKLLTKLDNRIYLLIKDDGILETQDHETIEYKIQRVHALAKQLVPTDAHSQEQFAKLTALLKNISTLFSLGEPEYESTIKIQAQFKQIRNFIKGMQLYLELSELDSDEEIPEHVYESFEPYVDPDTGECQYPTDNAFGESVLWRYQSRSKINSAEFTAEADDLIGQMETLSLTLNSEFQVDLGDDMTGVANPRLALQAELSTMEQATRFYFEPTHLKSTAEVATLAQAFYLKESTTTELCAGSLIIAACEALRSVHLLNEQPVEHEATLHWQGIPLSLQRKPTTHNPGNLLIRNLGSYGHRQDGKKSKWNVLDDFENVKVYSGEDLLKSTIAKYGSRPGEITCEMLNLPNSAKGKDLLKKLQQNMFLIFCAEIFRYFPIEASHAKQVKKIPFAIALSMGLELLLTNEIELEDLFDQDAALGLPTGSKILDSSSSVSSKLIELINKYQSYLQDAFYSVSRFKDVFPNGMVVRATKVHIEQLEDTFGKHLKLKR